MPRRSALDTPCYWRSSSQPSRKQALASCFREDWGGAAGKAKRIVLPVRHLQYWIEHNVLLLLKQAPFNKRMLNSYPPPEAASIAPSAPEQQAALRRCESGTRMLAPIPLLCRQGRGVHVRSRLQPSRR
jgi:hypothetical protein